MDAQLARWSSLRVQWDVLNGVRSIEAGRGKQGQLAACVLCGWLAAGCVGIPSAEPPGENDDEALSASASDLGDDGGDPHMDAGRDGRGTAHAHAGAADAPDAPDTTDGAIEVAFLSEPLHVHDRTHSHDAGTASNIDAAAGSDGGEVFATELVVEAPRTVHYALDWSWQGAEWDADAAGYSVDLPDGKRAVVRTLAAASASFELIVCEHEHDAGVLSALPSAGAILALINPFAARPARADHGYTEGSSYLLSPLAQDVIAGGTAQLGSAVVEPGHYCELHQVLQATNAEGLLAHQSLHMVVDLYDDAAVGVKTTRDVAIALPMASLPWLEVATGSSTGPLEVRVERSVPEALRALDFDLGDLDLAYGLLGALADATYVRVQASTNL